MLEPVEAAPVRIEPVGTIPILKPSPLPTSSDLPTPPTNNQLYNTFKAQEANFPLPKPHATIVAGTFNAQTGTFAYPGGTYTVVEAEQPDPSQHAGPLKPVKVNLIGGRVTAVNVYDLTLQFNVTGRQGDFILTIPGRAPIHAPQNQNYITVDVGTADTVTFTITSNGRGFDPDLPLKIDRPIVGAGAITIPVLPVSIIYAPPIDKRMLNNASWTTADTTGISTTVSFSEQNSQTKPSMSQFQSWADMANGMKTASEVMSKIPTPYTQAAGAALGILSGMLGSSSATETKGSTVTNQNSINIATSTQETITTEPSAGGPGSGDILYFLTNARVCWFATGGPIQLALVGWDQNATVSATFLKQPGSQTGLDLKTIQALLNLDPFVAGGPEANLPASRYAHVVTREVEGSDVNITATYSLTNTDMQQNITTTTEAEDDTAGLLAFLGIGVSETQKLQYSITQSSGNQITSTHTISRNLQFYGEPNEFYSVEVYCDVIFRTFAFRQVATSASPRVSGVAFDKNGKPLVSSEVTLVSNGMSFVTQTDASGNFAFRSGTIAAGALEIRAGGVAHPISFSGATLSSLQLKP